MKTFDDSSKKNKNEELKIEFEPFPGNVTKEDYIGKKENEEKANKSTFKMLSLIIIILFLFIFSSKLNEIVLYGNESNDYTVVNKFNGNYATIEKGRNSLLRKIGFEHSKSKKETLKNKQYEATYAYNSFSGLDDLTDSITVYYDEKNTVNYVVLSLAYKKDEFNKASVTADCNAILKNFIKMNTPNTAIKEVSENKYYYLHDVKTKTNATYMLKQIKNKYYVLTVIIDI